MNYLILITAVTTINFPLPTWFLITFSGSFIAFIFFCGGLYIKVREVCKDHPQMKKSLTRIAEILLQHKLTTVYVFSESPVKLTEDGEKAVKESGFFEFYEENKKNISDRLKKYNIKTEPDLEEACKDIMLNLDETLPKFELLKTFSYNNGEPISNILFACSIALRDLLSKEMNLPKQSNLNSSSAQ